MHFDLADMRLFVAVAQARSITAEERESTEMAVALASGAADVGLAVEAMLPDGLDRVPFCDDRLMPIAPVGDAIAQRRQINFTTSRRANLSG